MSNFTFWCGGYSVRDIQWLVKALSELKRNEWDPQCPIVFCGDGWQPSVRDQAIVSLLETLRGNTSARKLDIRHSDLDLKAQKSLVHFLQDNKCIESISLQNLREATKPLTIPLELFQKTCLSEIVLSDCILSDAGCCALGQMIGCSEVLRSLVLTKVKTENNGFAPLATALVQAKRLCSLKLDSLSFSLSDANKILSCVERNQSLEELQLDNLDFDHQHAPGLALLLANNTHLRSLSLHRNNLTGDAIEKMVYDGLVKNATLRKLSLSHNPVGDDGARHLVVGLQNNETLQELKLVECEIWQSGTSDLVQSLPKYRGVKRLSLDRNEVGHCGFELLTSLQQNVNVVHVLDTLPRLLQLEQHFVEGVRMRTWTLVDWHLRMNRNKRRFLTETEFCPSLVPVVYGHASADPSTLYHFLRQAPAYCVARPSP